jgi:hypothetical protein
VHAVYRYLTGAIYQLQWCVLYCIVLNCAVLYYTTHQETDEMTVCLSVCLSVRPSAASAVEECETDAVQMQEQGEHVQE